MIKLLVVEDEEIIRHSIVQIPKWSEMGVSEIRAAANSSEALKIVESFTPDLIISDIQMPGINGIELCRRLRERFRDIEILFLTGFDEKSYLKGAIDIGAVGYLEKPMSLIELRKTMAKVRTRLNINDEVPDSECLERKHVTGSLRPYCTSSFSLRDAHSSVSSASYVESVPPTDSYTSVVRESDQYIQDHFFDPSLSLMVIARHVNLTPQYLSNKYKEETGRTIGEYMTFVRIEQAKRLLENLSLSITDITGMIGYKDANYFSRLFKKRTGRTPSEYREQHEKNA